ncbi:31005_t:CDS:2, partial [Gigaspora margarita]
KKDLKQKKSIESGPEIVLVNLISGYLEVLDTWISDLGRPQSTNLNLRIKLAKHEAYKPYQEFAKMYPRDDKVNDLEIEMKKEEGLI